MLINKKFIFAYLLMSLIPFNLHGADQASMTTLRLDGIGSIKVGMTVKEAEKATGLKLAPLGPVMNECVYVAPNGDKKEINLMVIKGKIVRADVPSEIWAQHKSKIRSVEGIGLGDSLSKVKETYQGRFKSQRHPYGVDGKDFYILVTDPKDKQHMMIFEIMEGKVQTFRGGFKGDVQAIEGCA